jgi:hypothetical protein
VEEQRGDLAGRHSRRSPGTRGPDLGLDFFCWLRRLRERGGGGSEAWGAGG